uniref:Reverse transcriptase domain-containing protein n=1 Tax=Chenopodium quinoa TaxID=63459 RepID=A0A803M7W2_CHEQI
MFIDALSRHEFVSTLDGFTGYHQIRIVEDDRSKTAFRCPGSLGLNEYVAMPFGLKNVGATYPIAMNLIFNEMVGNFMEVCIDDVLVKSHDLSKHLEHLILDFERIRKFNLKMNPLKCAFGVKASNFLGFLVHRNCIELDQNKAKAILKASPTTNKKKLQKFLGQINYVRRTLKDMGVTRVLVLGDS